MRIFHHIGEKTYLALYAYGTRYLLKILNTTKTRLGKYLERKLICTDEKSKRTYKIEWVE